MLSDACIRLNLHVRWRTNAARSRGSACVVRFGSGWNKFVQLLIRISVSEQQRSVHSISNLKHSSSESKLKFGRESST